MTGAPLPPVAVWTCKYFLLEEFLRSETADALGDDNLPEPDHAFNLITITGPNFDRARIIIGRPIIITSGYRNPRVNRAVGGVANSDHALGLAGDGRPVGITVLEACRRLQRSALEFDQLIYEKSRNVFHLGFGRRMRRQVLTQARGPGTPVALGLQP